jgi:hypothetical protein
LHRRSEHHPCALGLVVVENVGKERLDYDVESFLSEALAYDSQYLDGLIHGGGPNTGNVDMTGESGKGLNEFFYCPGYVVLRSNPKLVARSFGNVPIVLHVWGVNHVDV